MLFVLFIAAAVAALTWTVGWWGVVLTALVVGAWCHADRGAAIRTALSALLAWGGLLIADVVGGSFPAVSRTLGAVMHLPGALLIVVTLLFAALLAWSSARVGAVVAHLVAARSRDSSQPRAAARVDSR